jgi:hypothetical protein
VGGGEVARDHRELAVAGAVAQRCQFHRRPVAFPIAGILAVALTVEARDRPPEMAPSARRGSGAFEVRRSPMSDLPIPLRPVASPWTRAAVVLLATLLLHALLLDWVQRSLVGGTASAPPTIGARLLPPPPPVAVAELPPPPPPPPRPKPRPTPPPAPTPPAPAPVAPSAAPAPPVEAAPVQAEAPAQPEAPPAEPAPQAEAAAPAEAAQEAPAFEATGESMRAAAAFLPDLRTALPGSARYVYDTTYSELRVASGTTVIDWTMAADGRYDLRMTTSALGITLIELHSQGALRAFGLAPERYTETRTRRAAQAASFDWKARRITFSAHAHERPLTEGAQDRISFQFQLMLLGRALPDVFDDGRRVMMWMVGRDDATAYRFRAVGREKTDTGTGPVDAVRLERVAAGEADARIDVWLAPQLGWLPVRLRFTDRVGRVTESVLRAPPA